MAVLTICGSSLFYSETVYGRDDPSYTFIQPNFGLKCKLVSRAFDGNKDPVTNL